MVCTESDFFINVYRLFSCVVIAVEPYHKFSIPIKSEEYEVDAENGLTCELVFTYTAKYPDEGPIVEIQSENFEKHYVDVLLDYLNEQINENLGMVMVFTLVSTAQEWLNEKWDEIKKQKDEEVSKKLKEEEEAERVNFCFLANCP